MVLPGPFARLFPAAQEHIIYIIYIYYNMYYIYNMYSIFSWSCPFARLFPAAQERRTPGIHENDCVYIYIHIYIYNNRNTAQERDSARHELK